MTPVVVLLSSPLPLVPSSPSSLTLDSSSNASSNTPPNTSSHPVLSSLTPSLTEVDRIFDHPLEAMLDPRLLLSKGEPLVDVGEDWPYGAGDVYVSHRFGIISLFQVTLLRRNPRCCLVTSHPLLHAKPFCSTHLTSASTHSTDSYIGCTGSGHVHPQSRGLQPTFWYVFLFSSCHICLPTSHIGR